MYRLLIVDDEQFIRKGILSILSRNLIWDITCIEASNGEEALARAREDTPHLIITDISMPGCDGLEFIARLREENKHTPIVILSGYDNFEYARKAIRLGVKEYIMKPIKKQEFITLIRSYLEDIGKQKARAIEDLGQKMENKRIMERLKQDALLGLVKCSAGEETERHLEQLKELGVEFTSSLYICAVIQYRANEGSSAYMDFVVKNILDEYFSLEHHSGQVINVAYDRGQITVTMGGNSREPLEESMKQLIMGAARLIKKYCKIKVYGGVGDMVYDIARVHVSFGHALLAANYKLYNCGHIVTAYDELKEDNHVKAIGLARLLSPVDHIDIFRILEQLQKIGRQVESRQALHILNQEYEEIQEYISMRLLGDHKGGNETQFYKSLARCWSFIEVTQEIKGRLEMLRKTLEKQNTSTNPQLSRQIRQYVDEHVTEDLDLNHIARRFKRTPGYISTIFKAHTEGGFNSYLNMKRLEIARRLLADSSVPIQEVSRLSGFTNAKYFSVVFKKMLGETPREYRNRSV